MTATERTTQWRQTQRRNGLCERCTKPAKRRPDRQAMSLCAEHLAYVAERSHARRHGLPIPRRPVAVITKEMLLHDLRCVAERLGAKRVSMALYEVEGSFSPKVLLARRIKQRWSELCVEAGLLPTFRGCRGIDERLCARCHTRKVNVYVGREDRTCWQCKRIVRKRTTETHLPTTIGKTCRPLLRACGY